MQDPGDGEVIQVVPGGVRQGAALAPAGHAAVDQGGVALKAGFRTQSEALHDAGTETLYQHVRALHQAQHHVYAFRALQVQGDRLFAAVEKRRVATLAYRGGIRVGTGAFHQHHLRPQIGEHHTRDGAGADAGDFNDFNTLQRSHAYLRSVKKVYLACITVAASRRMTRPFM